MTSDNLYTEINESLESLLETLSTFRQDYLNTIPFDGSWTAGQVAQHMVLSNSGFVQLMNGPVKESIRKPDELVAEISAVLSDFNTRLVSPDFVTPPVIHYKKEELIESLENIKRSVNDSLANLDLTKTCLAFELPVFGLLTRLEAAWFINAHTKRHTHQLRNIKQALENKQEEYSPKPAHHVPDQCLPKFQQ